MASAKMASAIGVRIDDVGSILKFRIGFPFGKNSAVFLPVRMAPGIDTEFRYRVRIVNMKGRRPTQKTTHPNKNSLHKQFAQTLFSVFCLFKREKGGQFAQTVPKLFAQTVCANCFYLGGWVFGWVFPS